MALKICKGEMEWIRKKVNQKMFYMLQDFWEE